MATTATPHEGLGIGAALGITVYGIAVLIASLADHEEAVLPSHDGLILVAMVVAGVIGAVLGMGFERFKAR